MFRLLFLSRAWQGMTWENYFLWLILVICLMAWIFSRAGTTVPNHVPYEAAALAPTEAIHEVMMAYEDQGFVVHHTRDLEPVRDERNHLIIEYVVTTEDRSDYWIFRWAWEVPMALCYEMLYPTGETLEELLDQCELIPLSEAAREIQETIVW